MSLTLSYRLRPEVEIHQEREGLWLFCPATGKMAAWKSLRPLPLLEALRGGWLDQQEMAALFAPTPDVAGEALFQLFFLRMLAEGLLDLAVREGGKELFSVSPAPEESLLALEPRAGAGAAWRLNRYAYLRAEDGGLLLESPLTSHRLLLRDPALTAMVHALAAKADTRAAGEGEATLLALLRNLGLAEADAPERDDDPMAFWEFHDLLFHARSLNGRHAYPVGGTYHFQGRRPSPPLTKKACSADVVDLPRPSAAMAARLEAPLGQVLEARRSLREFDPRPMTLEELGAFLHAAARLREVMRDHRHDEDLSMRPHAGGGARHPLEIYPLVRACQGLEPGAYHYDPARHALERVPAEPAPLQELCDHNPHLLEGPQPPQVSLYIAARIGRTAWKYQSIAYKIINQDLGCLYQTFYLAGTALGLAPCAIGSVDALQAGRSLGVDWREEPFVGLFTLGCPSQSCRVR
jgi:SagB-type dehydrogenase family enzyme